MRRPGLVIALVLLVGIAGSIVALASRQGDSQLIAQQQDLVPVSTAALERLMTTTHDPRPTSNHGPGRSAVCTSAGSGEFRNPWTCTVTYTSGPPVRYAVIVHSDRSITGTSPYRVAGQPAGRFVVNGCCVALGG
jgi:hypothetical protein